MFFLSKVFTYTFLSPGLFVFLTLLALVAILKDYRRISIYLVFISCLTLYMLSIRPVHNKIIYPLETKYPALTTANVDVLIVLGGGVRHNTLDNPRKAAPSDSSLQRVYFAYRLYHQKEVPIIVCGGAPLGQATGESTVMAEALINMGVSADKIHQENSSRNTKENLLNIQNYLRQQGYKNPGIITSAAHMPRSMRTAAQLGIKATALPCDFRYEGNKYYFYDIFPDASYLRSNFISIKEYIGLLYYQKLLLK